MDFFEFYVFQAFLFELTLIIAYILSGFSSILYFMIITTICNVLFIYTTYNKSHYYQQRINRAYDTETLISIKEDIENMIYLFRHKELIRSISTKFLGLMIQGDDY
jgi:uncharacterized membrane protein